MLNSPSRHLSAAPLSSYRAILTQKSVPSPEVTVPFCLVPSPGFSQAPWYTLPDHLCRFAVRPIHACSLAAFPGSLGVSNFTGVPASSRLSVHNARSFNPQRSLQPFTGYSVSRLASPSPSPHRSIHRYRNINLFPFDCASLLCLRHRLTLPRLTLDRKPWSYGERACFSFYRYLRQHSHFCSLHLTSQLNFFGLQNAPLPLTPTCKPAASVSGLAPLHLPRRPTRPVSYYAFFQ